MKAGPEDTRDASSCRRYRVLDLINTHECAKELLDARVAQVTATSRHENAIYCSSGEYVARLRERGHTVYVVETPRNLNPLRMMSALWRTWRLLRRERFDIVHTHTSVVGVIGRVAAFIARVPVIVHQVHGFHHHEKMPRLKRFVFIQAERMLAIVTDKLLFQNQADVEECLRRRIAPTGKLLRIGNGVQIDAFDPAREPDDNPRIVLCVGRFEPVKNQTMILEATRILKGRGVAMRLQLVGEGVCGAALEAWTHQHKLDDCVEFLGYRDDIPALIARASVCVLVSIKEGVPRALIEAAAGGRPAVATDVVGSRDPLIDSETGFLVPLNDAVVFADRLEQLLGDADLRRRMGERALAHARKNFDERAITRRIIQVYDEALGLSYTDSKA